jgi:hypothetical protein
MNTKVFQFNRRQVVALLLTILVLAVSASPALAYLDEGGLDDFGSSQTMTSPFPARVTDAVPYDNQMSEYPIGLLKAEDW